MYWWTNERKIPRELIQLLDAPDLPNELRGEIRRACDEVAESGAVTYPTKARIEYYLHKYSENLSSLFEVNHETASKDTTDSMESTIVQGTAKILSMQLLKLARQVLLRAIRRQRAAHQQTTAANLDELLEVYVLVAASLEVFMNEFCRDKIDDIRSAGGEAYWVKGLEEIVEQKMELRLKWRLVPQLLWQKAFDESRQPWQDFNVLVQLRNLFFHYRTDFMPEGKIPKCLEQIRHLVSIQPQDAEEHRPLLDVAKESPTWIDSICNLDAAKWAFNTGVAMIEQFLEFADSESRELYTWLLRGSGIRRIADKQGR